MLGRRQGGANAARRRLYETGTGAHDSCPVQLFDDGEGVAGLGSGWCGNTLLLQKHAVVVDPTRPAECIGVTKTAVASLAACRELLSNVMLPLMAASSEENWGACPDKEVRRVKHTVAEFCSLLDERAATYSEGQRALTLPSEAVRLGIAGAGSDGSIGADKTVAEAMGETVDEKAQEDQQESLLLAFEQLTAAWLSDMERALSESMAMSTRYSHEDGPGAEIRCWRQRVAMLGNIERQLETHECKL